MKQVFSSACRSTWRSLWVCVPAVLLVFACVREPEAEKPKEYDPGEFPVEVRGPFTFGAALQAGNPDDPSNHIYRTNVNTRDGVFLGRTLFYDPRLSRNGTISCASCHQQDKAFTDGRELAIGIEGRTGSRSSMALQNLAWQRRLFWDGRTISLEEQALLPIQDHLEMDFTLPEVVSRLQGIAGYRSLFNKAFGSETVSPERIAMALAQFERTLVSGNSRYDRFLLNVDTLSREELRGMNLFFTHPTPNRTRGANCGDCHMAISTAGDNSNNGLSGLKNNGVQRSLSEPSYDNGFMRVTGNASDQGRMKVPSLRNIAVTAPYMHDGRFRTLEEVLDHYNDPATFRAHNVDVLVTGGYNGPQFLGLGLTDDEKRAVIAFLKTLTDESFLTNPAFSKPPLPN